MSVGAARKHVAQGRAAALAIAFISTAASAVAEESGPSNANGAPAPAPRPAPPPAKGAAYDYDRSRLEPAAIPILGGNSDIGIQLGAGATLSKLGHGIRPYEWNMDLFVSVSAKGGPSGGVELTQQNYLWSLDVPGLNGGALRVSPTASYVNTTNEGYFGLGNASSAQRPANATNPGRYFEYTDRVGMVRELTRVRFHPPIDWMFSTTYRFENPQAYAGSKLGQDAAAGRVIGLEPLSLPQLGAGIVYDSRDNEYFPRDGSYHQLGLRYIQGIPFTSGIHYVALGAIFAFYRSIGGPFVLAWRALIDAEAGQVPFYDLFTGEPFSQDQIIGGSAGVRGVPEGRYLGKLKAIANLELRAMLIDFRFLGQSLHFGGDLLFDIGRTWLDYTFTSPADGNLLGLKWGVGGGLYLRWGQAGLFRLEAAYSPDAVSENPGFPFGVYVEDGVMF